MSTEEIKITRSFRMTPECVTLIQNATETTGAAQGDILEKCVRAAIGEVTSALLRERKAEIEAQLAVPVRGVGRPRKQTVVAVASPSLTKRQQH